MPQTNEVRAPKNPYRPPGYGAVERLNGLSRSMWRDLRRLAAGERCAGYHIGMMAKMGLVVRKGGKRIPPSHWTYVITDAGRAKLLEYPESLRAERARYDTREL
jgi:hypothetical protein